MGIDFIVSVLLSLPWGGEKPPSHPVVQQKTPSRVELAPKVATRADGNFELSFRDSTQAQVLVDLEVLDKKGCDGPDNPRFFDKCETKDHSPQANFAVQGVELFHDPEGHRPASSIRTLQKAYFKVTLVGVSRGVVDHRRKNPLVVKGRAQVVLRGDTDYFFEPGDYILQFDCYDTFSGTRTSFNAPLHVTAP